MGDVIFGVFKGDFQGTEALAEPLLLRVGNGLIGKQQNPVIEHGLVDGVVDVVTDFPA